MKAVIDTNVIFSSLLKKDSKVTKFLLDSSNEWYCCNYSFAELFKYKDRIERMSKLDLEAHNLCSDIDEKDTPFIALALFLKIPLITRDKKLIKALKEKGFEDIIPLDSVLK